MGLVGVHGACVVAGLEKLEKLTTLKMSNNQVAHVREFRRLAGLSQLREIDLSGNPVQNTPSYRLRVTYMY